MNSKADVTKKLLKAKDDTFRFRSYLLMWLVKRTFNVWARSATFKSQILAALETVDVALMAGDLDEMCKRARVVEDLILESYQEAEANG